MIDIAELVWGEGAHRAVKSLDLQSCGKRPGRIFENHTSYAPQPAVIAQHQPPRAQQLIERMGGWVDLGISADVKLDLHLPNCTFTQLLSVT